MSPTSAACTSKRFAQDPLPQPKQKVFVIHSWNETESFLATTNFLQRADWVARERKIQTARMHPQRAVFVSGLRGFFQT